MRLHRDLRLPEEEAQAVSLLRAVEEADRDGALIPYDERRRATAAARGGLPCSASTAEGWDTARGTAGGEPAPDDTEIAGDRWLAARASLLLPALGDQVRWLPALLRSTRLGRGLLAPVLVLAFAAGLATTALGPSRRIQVLAVPLLGLIAWNVAVVAATAGRRFLPLGALRDEGATPRLLAILESLTRRTVANVSHRFHRGGLTLLPRSGTGRENSGRDSLRSSLREALTGYLEAWFPAVAPLAAARLRRLLHASAGVLVAGVVAGMYLRGLALEYRVTWESTFLTAAAVDRLLGWVLAPAAAVLGTDVPSVAGIRSPQSGAAGPWIHLYAATAGLFVGLPRLALTIRESLRCATLRRGLALRVPEAYLRRLVAATEKTARRVEVLPYSHRPAAGSFAALKGLLLDAFGPRSDVRLLATVDYGGEPPFFTASTAEGWPFFTASTAEGWPDPGNDDGGCRIVLFSLAQTPEIEVHGELISDLRQGLIDGQSLMVIVDGAPYRRRLRGPEALRGGSGETAASEGTEHRLSERRRSWDRVLEEAGVGAVHLDLDQPLPADALTRLMAAAWPAGALELGP